MTIGPPQVGKTTLRCRLLRLYQLPIGSTDVVERPDTVMYLSESNDSDDDLGRCIAGRCTYESYTYKADGSEWVLVNNTSGLLSLLNFLQNKIDVTTTPVRKSFDEAPVQASSDDKAPMQASSDDKAPMQASRDDKAPMQASRDDETPMQASSDDKVPMQASSDDKAPMQASSDDKMPMQASSDDKMPMQACSDKTPMQASSDDKAPTQAFTDDKMPLQASSDDKAPTQASTDDETPIRAMSQAARNKIHQMYQELKKRDKAAVTLPDAHLLQFLDCGGQLAYHDILPLFVNIPAIYLHVFKVSKELTECFIDELRSPRGEKTYSAESALSVADMITRSMMTVHLLGDKKVQLPSKVKRDGKSPKPHIVFVGTHLDELGEEDQDARLKAIGETLRKAMQSESHDLEGMLVNGPKPYSKFFPVSNEMSHGRCTFENLKGRIAGQAEKDAVKVEVPVRWYLRQLLEMSQGEKHLYAYSELYQHSKEEESITDIGDFHAMVTYFHALGLLVHLCGADVRHTENSDCLVYTDPSYLFKNISKLYQVQFEEEVEGVSKLQLKREGKLTMEALQELGVPAELNHRRFMDLLVQLFIGAEIESPKGVRTLFVPSVLVNPKSAKDATSSGGDTASQEHSLCFAIMFNHTSFVPCGVFTGMIARLQSAPQWRIHTQSSSRTLMKFAVGALDNINVLDHLTHISVEMDCHDELKPEQCQMYRDTIIQATADSYCFLYHSKNPPSGTCSACTDTPYLVLGQSCRSCPPEPAGTHNVQHFAELKVENYIPKSVRCTKNSGVKRLKDSTLEQVAFQNISHHVSDD